MDGYVRFSNTSQQLINHYFTTIHEGNSTIPKQSEKVKSANTLVPCVLETRVLPMLRTLKTDGALISYQSFLLNGSTLQGKRNRHTKKTGQPARGGQRTAENECHASLSSVQPKRILKWPKTSELSLYTSTPDAVKFEGQFQIRMGVTMDKIQQFCTILQVVTIKSCCTQPDTTKKN